MLHVTLNQGMEHTQKTLWFNNLVYLSHFLKTKIQDLASKILKSLTGTITPALPPPPLRVDYLWQGHQRWNFYYRYFLILLSILNHLLSKLYKKEQNVVGTYL